MPKIHVIQRDGSECTVEAPVGEPLMDTLRDETNSVEGICGGACSCGTCHVYIDEAWQPVVGSQNEDESMMLDALQEFVELRPGSRLSCQIEVTDEMDGLKLEIAPEA